MRVPRIHTGASAEITYQPEPSGHEPLLDETRLLLRSARMLQTCFIGRWGVYRHCANCGAGVSTLQLG